MDDAVARIRAYFEGLTRAEVLRIDSVYTPDARFKDPFNEVQGTSAIARIFEHMFDTLDSPRFVVHQAVQDGRQCFLTWDFIVRRSDGELRIRGASHLLLAADGRIADHRDYWDAAEELYEKLPLLGLLTRALKRRLSAGPR
jgi:steroid Delta-isomerase